jgi:NADH-quinone oxidoreductase subunit E
MMQIDKDTYEDLDGPTTEKILQALRDGKAPKPGPQTGRHSSEPAGGPTTLKEVQS